ncbi:hypothetical protein HUW51_05715 [Adhaeribacter swui]|uniref:STAS/SEC14 domain-containing protein n=1 Tax=Adhaeribacter swui TaxID=2086471 RepID=A0A7G7G518_9BACT|nr:hypothetical protein [Adhaeribacter swui]QNF32252.1 hypothetical protein HUW51_05715 [Adhaeribacter swui]
MIYTSKLHLLFEDTIFKIELDAIGPILRLTWQQHPSSEDYRRGYRQAILLALEHKAKYWLTDSRMLPYLHMTDQHWMYTKMRPLLKGGKLQKMAIVMQPETLMMTDINPIMDQASPNQKREKLINMEFFLDLESAKLWLLNE